MSASNQKKIRQQEREVYRSERERQEALEAKKLRKQTIAFVVVIALCLSIFLGSFLVSPIKNVIYKNTVAVTVGGHELTAVDVNYFYIDAINNYMNQYYYYIYMGYIKLDTATPLNKQVLDEKTGETWADSFLSMAVDNIKSTYGLYDLAVKAGHKLTADEQKELDGMEASLKDSAKQNKFSSVKEMLQSTYGNGATLESYLKYYEICTYANSFYTAYHDSLEYTSEQLREFEGKETYKYNSYTYASYLISVDTFLPKLASGEKHTDEQKKAAQEAAKELADALAKGEFATVEDFDAAIDAAIKEAKGENKKDETNKDDATTDGGATAKTGTPEGTTGDVNDENTTEDETTDNGETPDNNETEGETPDNDENTEEKPEDDKTDDEDKKETLKYTSTKTEDVLYNSVSSLFKDWLIGKIEAEEGAEDEEPKFETRKEGEMTVIESTSGSGDTKTIKGYYVVRFGSVNDNTYALADVRHILVKFEGGKTDSTGKVTYTAAEKNKAKVEAEKIFAEFENGLKSEDRFSMLATQYTDDSNKEQGGLYEGVYPGQMVANFNDWCFADERKAGDYGLIDTEYGYHLMFYVGDNETNYRDHMVTEDKKEADITAWFEEIVKNSDYAEKNMKYVNMGIILGA